MIRLRDNTSGRIHEYGTDRHDSLIISGDGKYLIYENMQNGCGSVFQDEGYSFVTENDVPPCDDDKAYLYGTEVANVGGFSENDHIVRMIMDKLRNYALKEIVVDEFGGEFTQEDAIRAEVAKELMVQIKELRGV